MDEWMPLTQGCPTLDEWVLAWADGDYWIAKLSAESGRWEAKFKAAHMPEPTHWQPLPYPPKRGR